MKSPSISFTFLTLILFGVASAVVDGVKAEYRDAWYAELIAGRDQRLRAMDIRYAYEKGRCDGVDWMAHEWQGWIDAHRPHFPAPDRPPAPTQRMGQRPLGEVPEGTAATKTTGFLFTEPGPNHNWDPEGIVPPARDHSA